MRLCKRGKSALWIMCLFSYVCSITQFYFGGKFLFVAQSYMVFLNFFNLHSFV